MYKVEYSETEGTGAGYGLTPHQYKTGRATVFSKSIKRGVKQARRQALAQLAGWIPVLETLRVTDARTGKVIISR